MPDGQVGKNLKLVSDRQRIYRKLQFFCFVFLATVPCEPILQVSPVSLGLDSICFRESNGRNVAFVANE